MMPAKPNLITIYTTNIMYIVRALDDRVLKLFTSCRQHVPDPTWLIMIYYFLMEPIFSKT